MYVLEIYMPIAIQLVFPSISAGQIRRSCRHFLNRHHDDRRQCRGQGRSSRRRRRSRIRRLWLWLPDLSRAYDKKRHGHRVLTPVIASPHRTSSKKVRRLFVSFSFVLCSQATPSSSKRRTPSPRIPQRLRPSFRAEITRPPRHTHSASRTLVPTFPPSFPP